MFVRNGLKLLQTQFGNWSTITVTAYDGTTNVSFVSYNSSESEYPFVFSKSGGFWGYTSLRQISNNSRLYYDSSSTTNYASYSGVIIGDGDIEPSINDYKLSGNQITNFSATTAVSSAINDNKIVFTATYNITNTGGSDFTIKEIGMTRMNNVFAPSYRVLLTHDLLEIPVTIAAGDTGVVTYKIEIS